MAKKKTSWTARLARHRLWVQLAFLVAWIDPLLMRMHNVCGPVFHCYSCPMATFACPIGVMANFSAIHAIPFVTLGVLAVTGALLGGFICGWVCPFGLLQDLVGRIPLPKFTIPHWATYFRYVVLVFFVLLLPYLFGEQHWTFFCSLCPAGLIEGAAPNMAQTAAAGGEVVWPSAVKLTIGVVLLVLMLFTWRPWCVMFCPLGAIYSLCNSFSLFHVQVNHSECRDCDLCKNLCKYGDGPTQRANDLRCIRCLDCTRCDTVVLAHVATPSDAAAPSNDEPPAESND